MGFAHLGFAYAGIAPSLEKCYRKNPRAGFSVVSLFFRLHKMRRLRREKPARRFFPSIFPDGVRFLRRRSAGAEHDGARKMRFALIRGGVQAEGLRAASNEQKLIWAYSRFVFLMLPHPTNSFQNWSHINTA
ncbi:hypothetical protein [Methanocorpusculum sp. GPch4]|uniref:hypothetical protein n=1 Tax=Methanocorpusculum sp. GPch4 TaxID=2527877 RepID=UPI0014333F83|nr:hypothetical protein [Methanocorpusculum sp. GPch4]